MVGVVEGAAMTDDAGEREIREAVEHAGLLRAPGPMELGDLLALIGSHLLAAQAEGLCALRRVLREDLQGDVPEGFVATRWWDAGDNLYEKFGAEIWAYPKSSPDPIGPYPTLAAAAAAVAKARSDG